MTVEQILEKNIRLAKFETAKTEFVKLPIQMQFDIISKVSYKMESMAVYAFLCYMIGIDSDPCYHEMAVDILINTLSFFEGAYSSAYYHAKFLSSLEPDNIQRKELLLFFFEIPEKLVSEALAKEIAEDILNYDHSNITARRAIARLSK